MSNKFKKMAFEIENPEQSEELQKILFEQGYYWGYNDRNISQLHAKWLYTSSFIDFQLLCSNNFCPVDDQEKVTTQQYIDNYKLSKGKPISPPMNNLESSDGSHADYYQLPEGAKELQDIISYLNLNAQLGEIIRAVYRSGKVSHSSRLRDAKKIKFYAEAEIKRLEMYGE